MPPLGACKEAVTGKKANCHTKDYTQQRDMIPLPGRLLIWYVANALNDQKSRHEHVCADVAMLDEIPDCDG
jgi:hypothetical protein